MEDRKSRKKRRLIERRGQECRGVFQSAAGLSSGLSLTCPEHPTCKRRVPAGLGHGCPQGPGDWMCPWALGPETGKPVARPFHPFAGSVQHLLQRHARHFPSDHERGDSGSHKNGWGINTAAQTCHHTDAGGRQ